MARRLFVFDQPDRFTAGAVGEPGDRAFYLQARQGGALVTVGLEKTQVAALAQRIGEVLVAVGEADAGGVAAGKEAVERTRAERTGAERTGADDALETPLVELFRVGVLALGWEPETASVFVEARPVSEDGEYPEVADDDPDGPDLLRVRLDGDGARRFAIRAAALVAAGRPACPFCGQPLDPAGHFCPRMNGHLN